MPIDRANCLFGATLSDDEYRARTTTNGVLLSSNKHIPLLAQLAEAEHATYRVTAHFTYRGYNGHQLYCNGQRLVWREKKSAPISYGQDVKLISGNLNRQNCSSHNYPRVSFNGAEITLEFISHGLPYVGYTDGWSIHVIDMILIPEPETHGH